MTTTGTYAFNPSLGELVLYAFQLCQVRRPEITASHLSDARMAANLLQVEWANRGPNLWTVDLISETLTAGTATYSVDPTTVMILDAYIEISSGSAVQDRLIFPVSRTEYASFPNKTKPAPPTVFWFDRLISPTITLWPVPDDTTTYTLKYYRFRQIQDAEYASAATVEVQYRWLDALAWGLASRLAPIYAPATADRMDGKAERSWQIAATQDVENTPMYISPGIGGYFQ